MEEKVYLQTEGTINKVELRGRPDMAVLTSAGNIPLVSILVGENKSTSTDCEDSGISQLLFYLLLSQLKNVAAGLFLETKGIYMSPNRLQTVTVKPKVEEGPGSRLCFIKFSVHQERPIEEEGLVPILKKMWVVLATQPL